METTNIAGDTAPKSEIETPKARFNPIKKINPKLLGIAIVIVLLGFLAFYYKSLWIAATVDGHPISRWAIISKLEKLSGKSVLDTMIDDQLINNAANKKNITVGEGDLNKKLDEIKAQVTASGSTLEVALSTASMTLDDLKKQITLQLKAEQLLGDKLQVSDEELAKYIADNKVTVPSGQEAITNDQVRDQIKSEKFNTEIGNFITELRNASKINTYVQY